MGVETHQRITFYCDICGENLTHRTFLRLRIGNRLRQWWPNWEQDTHRPNHKYDLCDDCYRKLSKLVLDTHSKTAFIGKEK